MMTCKNFETPQSGAVDMGFAFVPKIFGSRIGIHFFPRKRTGVDECLQFFLHNLFLDQWEGLFTKTFPSWKKTVNTGKNPNSP